MEKKEFNWGTLEGFTRESFDNEFFNSDCPTYNPYQQVYSVREGDIVLDLGASIGPFTWNIQDKAEKVICVEPSVALLPALRSNVNDNVSIIEAAFGNYYQKRVEIDGIFDQEGSQKAFDKVNVIDFETICKSHFLDRIAVWCKLVRILRTNLQNLKNKQQNQIYMHTLCHLHILIFLYIR